MQKNNYELLSVTDAAVKIGVNRSTLFRQIKSGAVRSHEGKVLLSELLADRAANIDLTRSRRRAGDIDQLPDAVSHATPVAPEMHSDATPPPDATGDEDDATPVIVDGRPMAYADARALKETYLAKLKQLEFETKSGALVPVEEVLSEFARVLGVIRERLLAVPGKLSSTLVREHVEMVRAEIYDALEELHEFESDLDGADAAPQQDREGDGDPGAASATEPCRVGGPVPPRRAKNERRTR